MNKIKLILVFIFGLSSCAIVNKKQTEFGFSVSNDFLNNTILIINSHNTMKTGLVDVAKTRVKKYLLFRAKNELQTKSLITFNIDQALDNLQCSNEQLNSLGKTFKHTNNMIKNYFLNNFKIFINFTKARNYSFNEKIKLDDNIFTFYPPYLNCSTLVNNINTITFMVIHEIGHIYTLKQGIGRKLNNIESEYWASRIAHCVNLTTDDTKEIVVGNTPLLSIIDLSIFNQQMRQKSLGISNKDTSNIAMNILDNDIVNIININRNILPSTKMERLKTWCQIPPAKFTQKKIQNIRKKIIASNNL